MIIRTNIIQMLKYFICMAMLLTWAGKCIGADREKLITAKEYLNAKVTYIILTEYVENGHAGLRPQLMELKSLLDLNVVADAPAYEKWKEEVVSRFKSAPVKVCNFIDSIDIDQFTGEHDVLAATKLVDTVLERAKQRYPEYKAELDSNKALLAQQVDEFMRGSEAVKSGAVLNPAANTASERPVVGSTMSPGFFSMRHLSFWNVLAILLGLTAIILLLLSRGKIGKELDHHRLLLDKVGAPDQPKGLAGAIPEGQNASSKRNGSAMPDKRALENYLNDSEALKNMSRELHDLKRELSDIKEKNKNTPQTQPAPVAPVQPQPTVVNDNVFFMAGPVDNYFPTNAKSMSKENTVYRFIVKDNGQEATYEIHTSGAPVNEIVSMRERYIVPACNEDNLPGASVRSIKTTRSGIAVLEGDKWTIKTKASIRYE